ncbi:hypothetical protein BT63DRAFT_155771 [Microthyrium microscopicum]|uniref:Uncharacterized protein n=1 Tax=Microthyrium microscopicum TaxID=703497 RepID=A0A6A6UNQ5_9PEZI|nr:hypothetical protein BT63DRAFT_155771 [Microthyrium microscopicum]
MNVEPKEALGNQVSVAASFLIVLLVGCWCTCWCLTAPWRLDSLNVLAKMRYDAVVCRITLPSSMHHILWIFKHLDTLTWTSRYPKTALSYDIP